MTSYLVNEAGEKTAVLMPIQDYEQMLEDLEDLAVAAERRNEPVIRHQDFVEELRRDGLV